MTTDIDFEIRINPEYKSLVPLMTKEAFDSLVSSIRADGQHEPITINNRGEILDGHHRFSACKLLDIKPKHVTKIFNNPLFEKMYIIDVNLQRRQLTVFQRVELGLKKKPILQELVKLNESLGGKGVQICTPIRRVNEVIGRSSGASSRQVSKVEEILAKAPDELKNRARSGKTKIDKAIKEIRKKELRKKLVEESYNNPLIENLPSGIQLIPGNFIEKSKGIPDNSIDLIFTDPLYDTGSLILYKELASVAQRVLKTSGSLVVYVPNAFIPTITNYMMNVGLNYWWTIAVQLNGPFDKHYQRQISIKYKPLLFFVKGQRLFVTDFISDLIDSDKPGKIGSNYEQSDTDANHVISRLTVENQIVFDPMMGYATTGVAALRLKRKFIGIEKNEEQFRTAQLRMEKIALNSKVI